mmetsp:Transcript_24310/g.37583  ORF Transcript_24310/g.37583 Transcript_24310/m.37583 type:complete len:82 (+) Transcript_24310:2539-2784(+)
MIISKPKESKNKLPFTEEMKSNSSSPESAEQKKPAPLKKRNSFKIKQSLLNHVKEGGFKEGFSNDVKKTTTQEAQSKEHAA